MTRNTRWALGAVLGSAALYPLAIRPRQLGWGATGAELRAKLPGDEHIPNPDLTATRAITIEATPEEVWPWLAQLGQERAGFYTYDFLENLAGCDIHSADQIVPDWQWLSPGDTVHLHPDLALDVADVRPGRAVVPHGAGSTEGMVVPYEFTWGFVLEGAADGRTRLLVRERYGYTQWWSPLVAEPVHVASFVMTQKMLRGIRERAVRSASALRLVPAAGLPLQPGLDLYWIPLGAGKQVVRASGFVYETLCALVQRRTRAPIFHSALVATLPEGHFVLETTEIRDDRGRERGVVGEGAVGMEWLGRFRLFRYEVRRWREGVIPDLSYAVESPIRLTEDQAVVRQVLDLVPSVPTLVGGRDELKAGDMWSSNSMTSWLLAQVGLDGAAGRPPHNGRAPGWDAGLVAARHTRTSRPYQAAA